MLHRHITPFLEYCQLADFSIRSIQALTIRLNEFEKTVPQFLTIEEYTRLLGYFTDRADSPMGLRNLIIIMLLGTLGLRTATLTALNMEDVDLTCGLLWIREKGRRHRSMVLPHCICKIIRDFLQPQRRKKGPLLLCQTWPGI
jgi:integrase/recombinase XerC